jgi:CRP-like cAMP-binding protein
MSTGHWDKVFSDPKHNRARSTRKNVIFESIAYGNLKISDRHIRRIDVKRGFILGEAGQLFNYVYLPETAVITLSAVLGSGASIETVNVGNEGLFGFKLAIYEDISYNRCITQLDGSVIRIPAHLFKEQFENNGQLRYMLVCYLGMQSIVIQQVLACNSFHSVYQRLGRWLLVMHDYAGVDLLPSTHESLAHALGVDRKSVTLAAQGLQMAGLISYSRGMIKIDDRLGLESTACECHSVITAELRRFFKAMSKYRNTVGSKNAE